MVKTNNEEESERSFDSKRFAAYSPVIISMSLMLFIYTVYWNTYLAPNLLRVDLSPETNP
jgi:hypothetical protein